MIQILANQEPLDLFPDRVINLEFGSPLFYEGLLPSSYTLPILIPSTPRNRALLLMSHRIDALNHTSGTGLVGSVMLGSARIVHGELIISAIGEAFEIAIKQDIYVPDGRTLRQALEETQVTSLGEVVTCAANSTIQPEWTFKVVDNPAGLNAVSFQIRGILHRSTAPQASPAIDHAVSLVMNLNAVYPNYARASIPAAGVAHVHFLSDLVDNHPFTRTSMRGLEFVSHFSADDRRQDQQTIWLSRARIETAISDIIAYPLVRWEAFYGGANAAFTSWTNPHYNGVSRPLNQPEIEQSKWRYNYVPMPRLSRVLRKLWNELGITFDGNGPYAPNSTMERLLIWSNYATDNNQQSLYLLDPAPRAEPELRWMNSGYVSSIDTATLLPKVSCFDLLEALTSWYGFYLDAEGSHVTLRRKNASIYDPLQFRDWSAIIESSVVFNPKQQTGITLSFPASDREGVVNAAQLQPFVLGGGRQKIEVAVAPPFMTTAPAPLGPNAQNIQASGVRVPHTSRTGSNGIGLGISPPPLSFVHFAGMAPSMSLGAYQLATTETTDSLGNATNLDALSFPTQQGFYAKGMQGVVDLEDRPLVTIRAALSTAELHDVAQWRRSGVYFSHPLGNFRGVIKQVRISVRPSDTKLPLAQVTLAKID